MTTKYEVVINPYSYGLKLMHAIDLGSEGERMAIKEMYKNGRAVRETITVNYDDVSKREAISEKIVEFYKGMGYTQVVVTTS